MTNPTPKKPISPEARAAAGEIAASAIARAASQPGKPSGARQEAPGITKRTNSYFADPKMITRRAGHNARIDFGDIEGLAGQIKEKLVDDPESGGLLHDLHVKRIQAGDPRLEKGFVFEIIDGDRRLTAIELLMSKGTAFPRGVPVKIVDKGQSEIKDLIQMFVANDGKPFLPLEECVAYTRMKNEGGMTIAQICKAVGRKQMHVTSILALADADESLKQAVKEGKINKTMAKDIATNARGDKEKQAELTKEAVAAGNDKTKRRVITRKVEEAKQAKAVKRGKRVPKMRALSDAELSALGASIAQNLPKLAMDAKVMMYEKDFGKWISQDDKLVVAFTFGALQALKAAAGIKVKLEL